MQIPLRKAGNLSEPLPPASFSIPSKEQRTFAPGDVQAGPEDSAVSLFQDSFFLCNVKNVGDLPGTGNIFLEAVVEAETGVTFAKLYATGNVLNAVDILTTRVLPYYKRQAVPIQQIHTRRSNHYCGSLPTHPFETFLAASHIEHGVLRYRSDPYFYLCEQFYWFALREFFQPELRKSFRLSIEELQKNLDTFVRTYNEMMRKRSHDADAHGSPVQAKFLVDL